MRVSCSHAFLTAALPLGLVFSTALPGNAAITTFDSAVLADDGSNLLNMGNVFTAVNFTLSTQMSPTPTPTINGILFQAVNVSGSVSGTGFILRGGSGTSPIFREDNRVSGRPTTAAIYPLIYNAAVSSSGGTPSVSELSLTLTGLTIGQQYVAQFVFSSDAAERAVTVHDSNVDNSIAHVSYGTTAGPLVVTGTFTADAVTQSYDFATTVPTTRVQLSGFTVQAIPEPGTALLGLVGVAIFGMGRRRR